MALFCIFHALSFELNFFLDRSFPLKSHHKSLIWSFTNGDITSEKGRHKNRFYFTLY